MMKRTWRFCLQGEKRVYEMGWFVDEREKYSYRPNNRIKTKNPVK
jgi:hypothetical protein